MRYMESYRIQLTVMTHETHIVKLLALCDELNVKASVSEARMGEDGLLRDVIITYINKGDDFAASIVMEHLTQAIRNRSYEVIDGLICPHEDD